MDIVVVIVVLAALAVLFFKKFDSFIYYIIIVDIFFRIISTIASFLPVCEFKNFLVANFPSSLDAVIKSYSSGILETVLLCFLVLAYIMFEYYIIKIFFKKK